MCKIYEAILEHQKIIFKNPTLNILKGTLFSFEGDDLLLTSTDLETTLITRIPIGGLVVESRTPFAFYDHKKFKVYFRGVDICSIRVNGSKVCFNDRMFCAVDNGAYFPSIPERYGKLLWEVKNIYSEPFDRLSKYCYKSRGFDYSSYVCISQNPIEAEKIDAFVTDTKLIAKLPAFESPEGFEGAFLLSQKAVNAFKYSWFTIQCYDGYLVLMNKDNQVIQSIKKVQPPLYMKAYEHKLHTEVELNTKCIKRALLLSKSEREDVIVFEVGDDYAKAIYSPEYGDLDIRGRVVYGEDVPVSFALSVKNLARILARTKSETLTIGISERIAHFETDNALLMLLDK